MKIENLEKLTDEDQYHAAEAKIEDYMYRNDADAEAILDKLFALVALYETEHEDAAGLSQDLDFHNDERGWD